MGTAAQTADNRAQIALIRGATKTRAGDGSFRLGMRETPPRRCPLGRSCHAGGRGFESRRSRSTFPLQPLVNPVAGDGPSFGTRRHFIATTSAPRVEAAAGSLVPVPRPGPGGGG